MPRVSILRSGIPKLCVPAQEFLSLLLALPLYASLCENQTLHTQSNFRLLMVRLGAMGDILHALPAVTALRLAHPDWQIGWVVEPRWQSLLKGKGPGNREREIREQGARSAWRGCNARCRSSPLRPEPRLETPSAHAATRAEIGALRRELRAAGYSAVLDLQGAIRSAVIARMTGCPRRIGEASRASGQRSGSLPSASSRRARTSSSRTWSSPRP